MNTLIEQRHRPGGVCLGTLFALIVSVPFCGWAFDCGCDWPWRGLAAHCNYFAAGSQDKCPWCVHSVLGIIAVAGSVAVGAVAGSVAVGAVAGGSSLAWTPRWLLVVASVLAFLLIWAGMTYWIA